MEVYISCVGENSADAIESLSDWLRGEPELAGRLHLTGGPPRQNELGALADVLVVAVGSGGTLSVLAAALRAWLMQPHQPGFRVRVQGAGGRTVEIDAQRSDVTSVIRLLHETLGTQTVGE